MYFPRLKAPLVNFSIWLNNPRLFLDIYKFIQLTNCVLNPL